MPMQLNPDARDPVVPRGRYRAKFVNFKETTSKAGNEMIVLELAVKVDDGEPVELADFLVSTTRNAKRLYDRCNEIYRAVGLPESSTFDPLKVDRRVVEIEVDIEEQHGQPSRNKILAYYPAANEKKDDRLNKALDATPAQAAARAKQNAAGKRPLDDDDIPF